MSYPKHLMLNGATIPVCGDTTIGKVATNSARSMTCESCLAMLEQLKEVENYSEAQALIEELQISGNLKEHQATDGVVEAVLCTKEIFWKNMQKFNT